MSTPIPYDAGHPLTIGNVDTGEVGCIVCQNETCYDCKAGPHEQCALDCGAR